MQSDNSKSFSINTVKIHEGDIFDFVKFDFIGGVGPIEEKLYLTYKRKRDGILIYFTLTQSTYFTVNGRKMYLADSSRLDFNNIDKDEIRKNVNTKTSKSLNFVDSFTVKIGNEGPSAHRPNLDIDQPFAGIGVDWMKTSIEKELVQKALLNHLEDIGKWHIIEREKRKTEEKEEKEEIQRILKLLQEEEEKAMGENSYETLTRQFLTLNQQLFESDFIEQMEK